jgi:endonuclease/exonuclease/phosphatase family metal-dependent hydrolase
MINFSILSALAFLFANFLGFQNLAIGSDNIRSLKLMTYNIHKGLGAETVIKGNNLPIAGYPMLESEALSEISKIIIKEDPDLVAFQEIDHYWTNRSTSNQLEKIMKLTGNRYKYGLFIPVNTRDVGKCFTLGDVHDKTCGQLTTKNLTGNALLSKYPLKNIFIQKLSMVDEHLETPRAMSKVSVQIGKNEEVNLISTHLEVISAQTRERQIDEIVEYSRSLDNSIPLIMIGDFNADPEKARDELLFKKLKDFRFDFLKYKKGKTNTSLTCTSDIDHIGVRKSPIGGTIRQKDYLVVNEVKLPATSKIGLKKIYPKCKRSNTLPPQASDHKPVTAVIRFDS